MFVTSLKLTALVVAAVLLVLLPMILFGRWVRKLRRKSQDRIADTSARASETLNAVQTVQAFTHEDVRAQRFRRGGRSARSISPSAARARAP